MSEHFIKNIEITTFKCFDHFEASGFKQVNLIGGKNNIGKTALLEALYLGVQAAKPHSIKEFSDAMVMTYLKRNEYELHRSTANIYKKGNEAFEQFTAFEIKYNKERVSFEKTDVGVESFYVFSVNAEKQKISKKDFLSNSSGIRISNSHQVFLTPLKITYLKLLGFFQSIQEEDREYKINQYIQSFDKNLEKFKFINQKPKIRKNNKYRELNTFGDGVKAYLAIILAIYHCKDGNLFIDELENGIHYTQFDQLWEIILTASKQVNCQIFATTHSKECIDSYARTAKKIADKDISFITLVKNRKNKIEAINYRYETLQNSLSQDHEVRGW